MTEDFIEQDDRFKKQIALVTAFKNLFNTPEGERVLEHLKQIGSYNTSTIHPDDNRDLSHWREGRRSLVLDIIHHKDMDLRKYKEQYKQILKKEIEENE